MKEIELKDIIRISHRLDNGVKTIIVKVTSLPYPDGFLYKGHIIIPKSTEKHEDVTFFSFQLLHNFGQLQEKEFIENYPEYVL